MNYQATACLSDIQLLPPRERVPEAGVSDLQDNPIIAVVDYIFDEMLGAPGINYVVNKLTADTGVVSLDTDVDYTVAIPLLGNITFELDRVTASGLNTFQDFELVYPTDPYDLANDLSSDTFSLDIDFKIAFAAEGILKPLTEKGTLSLTLSPCKLNATVLIALNDTLYKNMLDTPEEFFDTTCLASILDLLGITEALVDVTIKELKITLGNNTQAISPLLASELGPFLHYFIADPLSLFANQELNQALKSWDKTCPTPDALVAPPLPPSMVDFNDNNPVINLLDYLTNDVVGINGTLNVNKMANNFTNGTGIFSLDLSNVTATKFKFSTFLGTVDLALDWLSIGGLNTWYEFDLLRPDTSSTLESRLALERFNLKVCLNLSVTPVFGAEGQAPWVEMVNISLDTANTSAGATVRVAIDEEELLNLTKYSYLLFQPACDSRPVHGINISHLDVHSTLLSLQIVADSFSRSMNTTPYAPTLSQLIHGLVKGPVRNMTNNLIHSFLNEYHAAQCDDAPQYEKTWSPLGVFLSLSLVLTAFIILVVIFVRVKAGKNCFGLKTANAVLLESSETTRKKVVSIVPPSSDDESQEDGQSTLSSSLLRNALLNSELGSESLIASPTEKVNEQKDPDPMVFDCLALHPSVPGSARYLIAIIILLDISIFVASNTGFGTGLTAVLTFGLEKVTIPGLFDFTLSNTVSDMWKAKVYPLSILVALFSGFWPYAKLILLLLCWIFPTRILSYQTREKCLMILDALGKWSLLDAYVLIMMLVGFRFQIVPPVDAVRVDLYVQPYWGFYSFLAATVVSLVLSHVVLYYHRASVESAEETARKMERDMGLAPRALNNNINHDKRRKSLAISYFKDKCGGKLAIAGPVLVSIMLVVSVAMILVGSIISSFVFTFGGLAGAASNSSAPRPPPPTPSLK